MVHYFKVKFHGATIAIYVLALTINILQISCFDTLPHVNHIYIETRIFYSIKRVIEKCLNNTV